MTFSSFTTSEKGACTIPNSIVNQSVLVITQLFVITEGIPVDINPSVLSTTMNSTSTVLTSGTSTTESTVTAANSDMVHTSFSNSHIFIISTDRLLYQ